MKKIKLVYKYPIPGIPENVEICEVFEPMPQNPGSLIAHRPEGGTLVLGPNGTIPSWGYKGYWVYISD